MNHKDLEAWKLSMDLVSGRGSDKDTLRFLDIALGSSAELETQLLIAQALEYADMQNILIDLDKINALIYGLKKYLKQKIS